MLRKEWVPLDVLGPVRTEPLVRVSLQQRGHDRLRVVRHVWREDEGVRQDALVHDVHVLVVEGRQAGLKLSSLALGKVGAMSAGEPTIISYRSTPSVHQSTVLV